MSWGGGGGRRFKLVTDKGRIGSDKKLFTLPHGSSSISPQIWLVFLWSHIFELLGRISLNTQLPHNKGAFSPSPTFFSWSRAVRGEGSNSHPGQQAFLALECFLSHVFENIYIASGMFLRSFTLQEDLHRHWRVVGMASSKGRQSRLLSLWWKNVISMKCRSIFEKNENEMELKGSWP